MLIIPILLLSLSGFYIFLAFWSYLRNPYPLVFKYLFLTYLLAGLNYICNFLMHITSENSLLFLFLFKLTIAFINLAIICLNISVLILIKGDVFFKNKIKIYYIIFAIIITLITLFYPNGVNINKESNNPKVILTFNFGIITVSINLIFLTIIFYNLVSIYTKLEKKIRVKPLLLSIATILIVIDMIFVALVDMKLLNFLFMIIPFVISFIIIFLFIIINLKKK